MGRNRTLLGTKPVLLTLSIPLVQALDDWADEENVSRNTLAGRELATAVISKQDGGRAKEGKREASDNPSKAKRV